MRSAKANIAFWNYLKRLQQSICIANDSIIPAKASG
jgi:hypothetical protein